MRLVLVAAILATMACAGNPAGDLRDRVKQLRQPTMDEVVRGLGPPARVFRMPVNGATVYVYEVRYEPTGSRWGRALGAFGGDSTLRGRSVSCQFHLEFGLGTDRVVAVSELGDGC